MSDFPRDSFVIVKTMAEAMERIQDPILKGKYAIALIKYGIYGDYDHDNDYIDALMTQDEKLISSMAAKYEKEKLAPKKCINMSSLKDTIRKRLLATLTWTPAQSIAS